MADKDLFLKYVSHHMFVSWSVTESRILLQLHHSSSSLNTPPFQSAHVGGMRHPALQVWGSQQVSLALEQVLVLWVVSQPAEQGVVGIISHAGVGQAHCQSHECWEVVGVDLQTPRWNQDPGWERRDQVRFGFQKETKSWQAFIGTGLTREH